MSYLNELEEESIYIIREAISNAENPVLLYSIGKDSTVLLELIRRAFHPAPMPIRFLHIDTLYKFQEMYAFSRKMEQRYQFQLLRYTHPDVLSGKVTPFNHSSEVYTHIAKTVALKQALDHYQFDIVFGGARRDEEKSRAKERIFSFRNQHHQWDYKNQRPEFWKLFNTYKNKKESFRVFPLSNWTELDVWKYIDQQQLEVVPLYFARKMQLVNRAGTLIKVDDQRFQLNPNETIVEKQVRFRTLGCYPLSGAIESEAVTVKDIINEIIQLKTSERTNRLIDQDSKFAMEAKKKEGYF